MNGRVKALDSKYKQTVIMMKMMEAHKCKEFIAFPGVYFP